MCSHKETNKKYKNITGNKEVSDNLENINQEIVKINHVKVTEYNKNGNLLKLNKKNICKISK